MVRESLLKSYNIILSQGKLQKLQPGIAILVTSLYCSTGDTLYSISRHSAVFFWKSTNLIDSLNVF